MSEFNPEMVILAREILGLSQAELAEKIGVTQSIVSRYESGAIIPTVGIALAMAAELQRPVEFFYWSDKLYDASCMYHRKNRKLSVAEVRLIHAKVNLLRIQAFRLLRSANVTSKYKFHRLNADLLGGPEGCARKLRSLWQMPLGPVRNVVQCIEKAGGIVFRCPFGKTRIDGISQWILDNDNSPPVFFVHDGIPGDRERLTLAHEIGHIVMHNMPTNGDPEEEANRFAAEFLMPAVEIKDELHDMTLVKAAAKKSHWKTSMQSLIMRSYHLGAINESQYSYLFRQLSKKGYRKCEPVLVHPEEPSLFKDLINFHQNELRLGSRDVANMLGETETNYRVVYNDNFTRFKLVG